MKNLFTRESIEAEARERYSSLSKEDIALETLIQLRVNSTIHGLNRKDNEKSAKSLTFLMWVVIIGIVLSILV